MTEVVHFGDGPLAPSRIYAEGWPTFTRERWSRILIAYRERVNTLYRELAEQQTNCFDLLQPLEIRVVVSLIREWVFIRPAATDSLVLDERWEDPQLSQRSMYSRADHERVVRETAGIDGSFELFLDHDLSMRFDLGRAPEVRDRHRAAASSKGG